jgi:hypothetical protein
MANTPRWKGSQALTEQPTSPTFESTKEGPRYTRVWRGPYAKCISDQPARLQTMAGTPSDFKVDTVRIAKQPGGSAEMTVTLTPAPVEDYTTENNETLELDWVEIQKDIRTHPMFGSLFASSHPSANEFVLTEDDQRAVAEWETASTAADKATKYTALTAHAKELAKRLQRGQDSYVVYAPLCRRTTKNAARPTKTRCGKSDNPPAAIKVDGYKYIKTADRSTRDRTWTSVEEWTGADEVDTKVYPA